MSLSKSIFEGVRHYSDTVLINNWYEDRCRKENESVLSDTTKTPPSHADTLDSSSRSSRTFLFPPTSSSTLLSAQRASEIKAILTQPVPLSNRSHGYVHFGERVQVVSQGTGTVLALVCTATQSKFALTLSGASRGDGARGVQRRSTWCLRRAKDDNDAAYNGYLHESDVVHYGQRMRLVNEDCEACVGTALHVCSEMESGHYASERQRVIATRARSVDTIFMITRPRTRRGGSELVPFSDAAMEGVPVQLGEPIVFVHTATNRPLCCSRRTTAEAVMSAMASAQPRVSGFGLEAEVHCGFSTTYLSRMHSSVSCEQDNIFTLTASLVPSASSSRENRVLSISQTAHPSSKCNEDNKQNNARKHCSKDSSRSDIVDECQMINSPMPHS